MFKIQTYPFYQSFCREINKISDNNNQACCEREVLCVLAMDSRAIRFFEILNDGTVMTTAVTVVSSCLVLF